MVALPLDTWGVPSGLSTSLITRYAFLRPGSGKIATGCNKQSEEWPVACSVELPSKDQMGQPSKVPSKFFTIFVLLRRLCVGLYPSSQMYSSFVLDIVL